MFILLHIEDFVLMSTDLSGTIVTPHAVKIFFLALYSGLERGLDNKVDFSVSYDFGLPTVIETRRLRGKLMMDGCAPSSGIPLDARNSCATCPARPAVRQHCNFFLSSFFSFGAEHGAALQAKIAGESRDRQGWAGRIHT